MFSGRFLLSLSALAFGGMSAWTSVSLQILSPIDFGGLGPFELLLYGIAIAAAIIAWLYIFFRSRGSYIRFSSRPILTISAFSLGGMSVMVLLYFRVIWPVELSNLSSVAFTFYAFCFASPLVLWLALMVQTSRGHKPLSGS